MFVLANFYTKISTLCSHAGHITHAMLCSKEELVNEEEKELAAQLAESEELVELGAELAELAESAAESAAESVAESVAESAAESAAESVAESAEIIKKSIKNIEKTMKIIEKSIKIMKKSMKIISFFKVHSSQSATGQRLAQNGEFYLRFKSSMTMACGEATQIRKCKISWPRLDHPTKELSACTGSRFPCQEGIPDVVS